MTVLIGRGLIKKRSLKKQPVYELLPEGEHIARDLCQNLDTRLLESLLDDELTPKPRRVQRTKESITADTLSERALYTNDNGSDGLILLVDTQEGGGERVGLGQYIGLLRGHDLRYRTTRLPVGDYGWSWRWKGEEKTLPVLVERKRADDLALSLRDGRYIRQREKLKSWKHSYLSSGLHASVKYLIEGRPEDHKVKCQDGCGAVLKCGYPTVAQLEDKINEIDRNEEFDLLRTANLPDTMELLALITKELQHRVDRGEFDVLLTLKEPLSKNVQETICLEGEEETKLSYATKPSLNRGNSLLLPKLPCTESRAVNSEGSTEQAKEKFVKKETKKERFTPKSINTPLCKRSETSPGPIVVPLAQYHSAPAQSTMSTPKPSPRTLHMGEISYSKAKYSPALVGQEYGAHDKLERGEIPMQRAKNKTENREQELWDLPSRDSCNAVKNESKVHQPVPLCIHHSSAGQRSSKPHSDDHALLRNNLNESCKRFTGPTRKRHTSNQHPVLETSDHLLSEEQPVPCYKTKRPRVHEDLTFTEEDVLKKQTNSWDRQIQSRGNQITATQDACSPLGLLSHDESEEKNTDLKKALEMSRLSYEHEKQLGDDQQKQKSLKSTVKSLPNVSMWSVPKLKIKSKCALVENNDVLPDIVRKKQKRTPNTLKPSCAATSSEEINPDSQTQAKRLHGQSTPVLDRASVEPMKDEFTYDPILEQRYSNNNCSRDYNKSSDIKDDISPPSAHSYPSSKCFLKYKDQVSEIQAILPHVQLQDILHRLQKHEGNVDLIVSEYLDEASQEHGMGDGGLDVVDLT